jgi:hypothetical protein
MTLGELIRGRSAAIWSGSVLLVLLLGLAAADPLLHWGSRWTQWPMVAQVLTGLLLLALTVFSVDAVVRWHDDRTRSRDLEARWRGLGGIPFRSLAAVCGDLVDGLGWLLTSHHPFGRPSILQRDGATRLRALLAIARVRERSIPSGREGAVLQSNLERLLGSERWCKFAWSRLHLLKRAFREGVAAWTVPMLTLEELADVLARMAEIDQLVGDLQTELARLGRLPGESPGAIDKASAAWFTVLAATVSLREDLIRAALWARETEDADIAEHLAAWERIRGWVPDETDGGKRIRQRANAATRTRRRTDAEHRTAWQNNSRQLLRTRFEDHAAIDRLLHAP